MEMLKRWALWKQILVAIILGAILGVYAPGLVPVVKPLGDIFLRLLRMLIAPLVLFTLISGVCKMGDIKSLRTVGLRIVGFYVITTMFSAALGLGLALLTQPGQGVADLLVSDKVGNASLGA